MRFKVSLKKNGKEFDEIVIANNKLDAIKIALKNNPDSEVINSDWTFKLWGLNIDSFIIYIESRLK